jgi:hypothetical protein
LAECILIGETSRIQAVGQLLTIHPRTKIWWIDNH